MSLEEKIKGKEKTIHQHIHKNAEIWNKGDYKKSEEYGEQQVILVSDVLSLLQDHKQKLREFEELLENRPKFYLYRCDEKDSFILALKEVDKHFELLEKKFRELKEK